MSLAPDKSTLEPIERASRDEVEALQLERLKWTVRHAYENVARYKQKFDDHGVHPDDLRALSDIVKFPYTTKEDLRQTYPFGMFAVPRQQVVRVHASSGTTGKPTVVGYTAKDLDTWTNLMARSLRACGARPGDIVHNAYGYGLFTGGLGAHYGAERLGCTVVPVSGGMTERQVQLIDDFKPRVLMSTPSYALAIAEEFDRQGLDARKSSIEIGFHGAEPWTDAMRREIDERFDMSATDHFGLSEIIGPGVAQECIESMDGLTIWEDHFLPEVIDPESAAPLADGEPGELVFTTLSKEALPMIRYRTRDLTRLLPPTARPFRRFEKVTGRSDDMLIIRGVNLFPSQVEELIMREQRLTPHYLLEVRREGPLDELTVITEARPETAEAGQSAMDEAGKALVHEIKSRIGVSATVRVMPVGGVERSIGKAKRINDLRPK